MSRSLNQHWCTLTHTGALLSLCDFHSSCLSLNNISNYSYTVHTVVAAFSLPITHSSFPDTHIYIYTHVHTGSYDTQQTRTWHLSLTFRSRCTTPIWWQWSTASRICWMQWLHANTRGAHVSPSSVTIPCTGQGDLGQGEKRVEKKGKRDLCRHKALAFQTWRSYLTLSLLEVQLL